MKTVQTDSILVFKTDKRVRKMTDKRLRQLSELPETKFPFISLYLNINAHELFGQAEENRIFIKNSMQEAENRLHEEGLRENLASFRQDCEKILFFLENRLVTKAHGVAIFACTGLGIFRVFQSIMPFKNSFSVNSIPHLKQLAYHFDENENALVVMTDKRSARIYNVEIGGFVFDEADMEHEVHRFHKQGGWAQMRYQRHIENQVLRHYKDVANVATELLDNNRYDNFILLGQHQEIKNLQKHLPKRINAKIIHIDSLDMRENVGHVLEKIIDDLSENESKKEVEIVKNLLEKAPTQSATGMQDSLKLVSEGRADMLILPENKTQKGWKCGDCLYVEKDQKQAGCPYCGEDAIETDLVEELVKYTLKNNGEVELINNSAAEELEHYGGVGVLVRY